jgi:hypothetical protein
MIGVKVDALIEEFKIKNNTCIKLGLGNKDMVKTHISSQVVTLLTQTSNRIKKHLENPMESQQSTGAVARGSPQE